MMNFLLVGHGGSYNRGCEAILRTTLLMLRKNFKKSSFVISAFDYKNERNLDYGDDVKIIPAVSNDLWKLFTIDWFLRRSNKLIKRNINDALTYKSILGVLKNIDVVLSIGGDNYTQDYSFPEYFIKLNNLIKKAGKTLVIWGASIGPFKEDASLSQVIESLRQVDLITARETLSIKYLESIGISRNVKRVADPAFLLMPDEKSTEYIFHDIDAPILGVNISPILAKYSNGLTNDDIVRESILFLRKVITDMKFYVFLIPHVTQSTGFNNDYTFMQKIFDGLKNTKMIMSISTKYNAMQMKSIISKCRFFIGARTHSTIAALSTGVPTLSIGYSIKAQGINKDLFGHNDYVLNVANLSADLLFDKFMKLLSAEHKIKNILLIQVSKIKELANKNIEYLKEILNKR